MVARMVAGQISLQEQGGTHHADGGPLFDAAPAHIIIGGGPAGTRAAGELANRTNDPIILFSDERWGSYNRVKLTSLLAREVNLGQIQQSLTLESSEKVLHLTSTRITEIDREDRLVRDHHGRAYPYLSIIIATGSRAFRPPIPGLDKSNVLTFRSLNDVEHLIARVQASRHTVVIGGGLLGLEVARGIRSRGTKVTVLENEPWLMSHQLDRAGGEELAAQIEDLGITVRTSTMVKEILGGDRVEGLALSQEEVLDCDTLVLCTGVRPNKEIARDAGIHVGRGITVTSRMVTSDPDIYAIGECAEHNGYLEGLVAPGLEQARVAAANIAGEAMEYSRREPTTRLKVAGAPVFSTGDVVQADQRSDLTSRIWKGSGGYRRLLMHNGRLIGAIAIGDWEGLGHVQQLVQNRARIGFFTLRSFTKDGSLPGQAMPASVVAWSPAATVCNCTGVTRGQLEDALCNGCRTVDALARATSASTVCGTCKPLLQELTGDHAAPEPTKKATPIFVLSMIALAAMLLYTFLPDVPMEESFNPGITLQDFFIDGTLKQITGFTLLALATIAAFLSLRRRIKWLAFGDYATWRVVHLSLGVACVGVLVLHSGMRLGTNLNAALMLSFLGTVLAGAVAGAVIAKEHRLATLGPVKQRKVNPRGWSWWLHMLLVWPLPLLLTLHIATVYFY